jgi:hypothetical protein
MLGLGLPQPFGVHDIPPWRTRLVTPSTFCVRTVIDAYPVSAGATHARLSSRIVSGAFRGGVIIDK